MHRDLLDLDPNLVFLNQCGIGPLPKAAVAATCTAIQSHARKASKGMPGLPLTAESVESCRAMAAQLVGASVDEICFVKNTVEGLCTVASGIRWKSGDNIVSNRLEFPANIYVWMNLAELGVSLRLAEPENGRIEPAALFALVDDKTRAIAISFVQFLNGYRADLEAIGSFCRERGILFIVDAIQGLGVLQLDVHEAKIDFLAAGGHKWLLSPIGSGILYCRRELIPAMRVSDIGHLSIVPGQPFTAIDLKLREDARRFEGGIVGYSAICGLGASLSLFLQIGMPKIETYIANLTDYAAAALENSGFRVISPRRPGEKSGIVSFELATVEQAERLHQKLDQKNFVLSRYGKVIRVAPHFFNEQTEIDALLHAMGEASAV
jgi:cysteine desulfurase / selenocysteine lyase